MARARLLKPGFFKNDGLARLSMGHRLTFAGLWTLADREGRLEDRPNRIRIELFPYEPEVDMEAILRDLDAAGFIRRYTLGANKASAKAEIARAIAIPTFLDHQTPHHREPVSRIPAPPSRGARAQPRAIPGPTTGKVRALGDDEASLADPVTGDPVPEPESVTGDPEALSGVGVKSSGARAPRNSNGTHERSEEEKNLKIITKIAHEALDLVWAKSGDLPEVVKSLCGERGIAYDSSVVRKAIESAEAQRRHP